MPRKKKAYRGSWDPLEDIVKKLDNLGVPYCLLASQVGMSCSVVWSSLEDFDNDSIELARDAISRHLDGCMDEE